MSTSPKPRIVVLDGQELNPGDLSWDAFAALGDLVIHDVSPESTLFDRARDASVLLTNKTPVREPLIDKLPDLRFIGVLATGYDVVDVEAAASRKIPVANVPTYGTHSVAQFVFALLLELCHHVTAHSADVQAGGWQRRGIWSYRLSPLVELAGKTMGIIGLGRIGRQTAVLAQAFGMHVLAADPKASGEHGIEAADVDDLLRRSDVVSLHCPLTPETRGLINAERIARMKPSAFLINTSRGPLVDESALAAALAEKRIAGAGLDVLPVEPPTEPSPLMSAPNCIVTPHIAWATKEARARLLEGAASNLAAFLKGQPVNVINGLS